LASRPALEYRRQIKEADDVIDLQRTAGERHPELGFPDAQSPDASGKEAVVSRSGKQDQKLDRAGICQY
jgi:hypothetical protein